MVGFVRIKDSGTSDGNKGYILMEELGPSLLSAFTTTKSDQPFSAKATAAIAI